MNSDIPIEKTYGAWRSPHSIEQIVSDTIILSSPTPVGDNLYWLETRPLEKGRNAIVQYKKGNCLDILAKDYSARSKVHEYGGGSYLAREDALFFCNDRDQRIYRIQPPKAPEPITADSSMRYADMSFDKRRNLLYAVREEARGVEIINNLVMIDPEKMNSGEVIAAGCDFYSNPRVSPSGYQFAYLCWNHPDMPWDNTKLMLHEIKRDGSLQEGVCIAGGERESICNPSFSPDGTLYFVSDRSGYWNLYRYKQGKVEQVLPMEAEFGYPQWVFGLSSYAFVPNNGSYDIIAIYTKEGIDYLGYLSLKNYAFTPIQVPYTSIKYIQADEKAVYFVGASPLDAQCVVRMQIASKECRVLKKSKEVALEEGAISVGQRVEFPTHDDQKAFAFFYPPQNPAYIGPQNERPPLIVRCHGGPTSHASNALNLDIQFWTSRGFAVLDVNYRGSSGYGREYRRSLSGNWGIFDVNDCCEGAIYLAHQGLIDRNRMAIKGGSAGGYIALCAIAFRDVFQGAVSYFGISDLEKMAGESEKFEAHYHESLIGPYPKMKKEYEARSPIHFIKNIHVPLLLLHGADDKIVLPSQSEEIFHALKKKEKEVYYLLFEKEGHGFKKAENLRKALQAECEFYSRIFHVDIDGLSNE